MLSSRRAFHSSISSPRPQHLRYANKCPNGFWYFRVKECGQCRAVVYCSRSCQRYDWETHRRQCARLASLREGPYITRFQPDSSLTRNTEKDPSSRASIIPGDIKSYYYAVILQWIYTLRDRFLYLSRIHHATLRPSITADGDWRAPSHAIHIDHEAKPIKATLVKIRNIEEEVTLHGKTGCMRELQGQAEMAGRVLVCATFWIGIQRHAIMDLTPNFEEDY